MTMPFMPAAPAGQAAGGARRDAERTVGQGRDDPALSRDYPEDFLPDAAYRAAMPDLQNGPSALIRGARRKIQHVGISNFRVPLRFRCRDASEMTLQVSVTGTVSLAKDRKGINMSRIMRSFFRHGEVDFDFDTMAAVLDDYLRDLESTDARLLLRFCYPLKVMSLRSGLAGIQYYDIAMELVGVGGHRRRVLHLDYVYSSTCPCSLELSEHARRERHQLATPHSQRSVARISVEWRGPDRLWIEDLVDMARKAVPTETQVMVKREDEQAFAELNAANPIFVEDAARLFCVPLQADPRIGDFRIVASHQESLHSHDAISVLTAGDSFAAPGLEPALFETMIKAG